MLAFGAPVFLVVGALLSIVPIALHMLARMPPERRPLPTARFLTVDHRTRLQLRPPTDRLLLALRVLLLLLLAAAFAEPEWRPDRAGSEVVVLLEGGEGSAAVWPDALDAARDRLREGGALVVFDSAARVFHDPEPGTLDSIRSAGPSTAPSRYLAAFRGLHTATAALAAESASAVLITRLTWDSWSPALPFVRETAWPGAVEVVEAGGGGEASRVAAADVTAADVGAADAPAVEPRRAAIVGPDDHPLRPFVAAGLWSLGYEPATAGERPFVTVILPGVAADATSTADHTVVLGGPPASTRGNAGDRSDRGRLVLSATHALEGWVDATGHDADHSGPANAIAVWEDGRPAAAVQRGEACTAYLLAEPATPAAAADPAFPRLLAALIDSCSPGEASHDGAMAETEVGDQPLDAGALTVLRGPAAADDPAEAVEVAALGGVDGHELWRVVLLLALLVALTEAAIAYAGRSAGSRRTE